MKLVFLPEADRDIDRLFKFLNERDPIAAQKAMLAIDKGISLLTENPQLGIEMELHKGYRTRDTVSSSYRSARAPMSLYQLALKGTHSLENRLCEARSNEANQSKRPSLGPGLPRRLCRLAMTA